MAVPVYRILTWRYLGPSCSNTRAQEVRVMMAEAQRLAAVLLWLALALRCVQSAGSDHLLAALHATATHTQSVVASEAAPVHPSHVKMCFPSLQVAASGKNGKAKCVEANSKVYQPNSFARIRRQFGIAEAEFAAALSPSNLVPYMSNSKSGQAFWRSRCGKYFIKTQSHADSKVMRSILPRYLDRVCSGAGEQTGDDERLSLLCPIFGIYRIHLQERGYFPFLQEKGYTYLIVMKALEKDQLDGHQEHEQASPTVVYDLKGSLAGRKGNRVILKDQDFLANNEQFHFTPEQQQILMNSLREDVDFLASAGLMDYSLLVAIRPAEVRASDLLGLFKAVMRKLAPVSLRSKDDRIYTLMLIDFLQRYTLRKRLETLVRSLLQGRKRISAVPPREYASRFLKTIQDKMVLPQ